MTPGRGLVFQSFVNPHRQRREVWVERAYEDPEMTGSRPMKADEMAAVQRDQDSLLGDSEAQHLGIGDALTCPTALGRRQHIVTKLPKLENDREWEILIAVDPGHGSCVLVVGNLLVDLVAVGTRKRPRIRQILGSQRGITAQEVGLARSQSPGLNQEPNGNTSAEDTRLPSAHVRPALNPWECVTQIARNPLKDQSLLRSA
jgi:hypothetical protein